MANPTDPSNLSKSYPLWLILHMVSMFFLLILTVALIWKDSWIIKSLLKLRSLSLNWIAIQHQRCFNVFAFLVIINMVHLGPLPWYVAAVVNVVVLICMEVSLNVFDRNYSAFFFFFTFAFLGNHSRRSSNAKSTLFYWHWNGSLVCC